MLKKSDREQFWSDVIHLNLKNILIKQKPIQAETHTRVNDTDIYQQQWLNLKGAFSAKSIGDPNVWLKTCKYTVYIFSLCVYRSWFLIWKGNLLLSITLLAFAQMFKMQTVMNISAAVHIGGNGSWCRDQQRLRPHIRGTNKQQSSR